jgi:energy-coupling factor transporter ATP-binding protein EcfA2
MRLVSIRYSEWEGNPNAWVLDELVLCDINLLVGKNASGKSRCLNLIHGLAGLLIGRQPLVASGDYCASFKDNQRKIEYRLKIAAFAVVEEILSIDDGRPLLKRGENGIGEIYYEKLQQYTDFQLPQNQLAALARQDNIQHGFLLPLHEWATRTYHYPFGSRMGQDSLGLFLPNIQSPVDFHDAGQVIGVYRKGEQDFGSAFNDSILEDMASIGYDVEEVGLMKPTTVVFNSPVPADPVYLYVKERCLNTRTEQHSMSQGMFRVLSTLVHLTYGYHSHHPTLILIDDIGEGLDFERATSLLDVIIRRAQNSDAQLVMATNDRFVMNTVPLEYWSVLERRGAVVKVHNRENAKQKFEDFRFTGLNNFDFFASDFIESEEIKL